MTILTKQYSSIATTTELVRKLSRKCEQSVDFPPLKSLDTDKQKKTQKSSVIHAYENWGETKTNNSNNNTFRKCKAQITENNNSVVERKNLYNLDTRLPVLKQILANLKAWFRKSNMLSGKRL